MPQAKEQSWTGKTRGGSFGYAFFILLIKALGPRVAYTFLCLVVPYFIPFAPKATRATWLYARKVLQYNRLRSVQLLFLNYYRLGQTLIDKIALSAGKKGLYTFDFGPQYESFLQTLQSQQAVLMLGAHVGSWEMGAPFFDEYGKKMHIVLYDAEYQRIKEMLARNKEQADYQVIAVNKDELGHIFAIQDALAKHEYVCMQGDRFTAGTKTLSASFMNREASFPAGPFVLASRFEVPTVFYFATREKGMKYRFHFTLAKATDRHLKKKAEEQLLDQYSEALEAILQSYPEQWFNYYPFWNEY